METYGWRAGTSLIDWLYEDSSRFDFYQVVRILELIKSDAKEVGEGNTPNQEPVSFKSEILDSFPLTDIAGLVRPETSDGLPTLKVSAMSLAGNFGPLPRTFSELIQKRISGGDTAIREFLDIFNHRLISLLYRVRKKNRLALSTSEPHKTSTAKYLFSFLGLLNSRPDLQDRMAFPDRALLAFSGLLSRQPRSPLAVRKVIANYFSVPVKIRQFQGRWLSLEKDQWTIIGKRGQNQCLGKDSTLGQKFWDQQGKVEFLIGPVSYFQLISFLPDGEQYRPLCDLIEFCVGRDLDYSIRLGIKNEDIPRSGLPKPFTVPSDSPGMKLGVTSWIKSGESKKQENIDWQVKLGQTTWFAIKTSRMEEFKIRPENIS